MSKSNIVVTKVNDKEVKLKVIKVTPEIALESSEQYAKAFNIGLSKGMLLHEELRKIYESRGLLDTTADDKKLKELRKEIKDLEIELRKGRIGDRRMTKDEGRALALKIRVKRGELSSISGRHMDLFSNSVENYADNERSKYLIFACTVYADTGDRFWPTVQHFIDEKNNELATDVIQAFVNVSAGRDGDPSAALYENQWLHRMGFMNDKYELVRADGKAVDEEGRLINSDGRFVDENGDYVDIYGNPIDKEGNLLVEDTWEVKANSKEASEPNPSN